METWSPIENGMETNGKFFCDCQSRRRNAGSTTKATCLMSPRLYCHCAMRSLCK